MELLSFQRHNRSESITYFEDCKINEPSLKFINETNPDLSTKETPLHQTPIDLNSLSKIQATMNSLKAALAQEKKLRYEKKKFLQNKILESFFNPSYSKPAKKKKLKNPNKSLIKPKKSSKLVFSEANLKVSDLNPSKRAKFPPSQKPFNIKMESLGKITSRSMASVY